MPLQDTLQAVADPVRREILRMLKQSSMTAGEISASFPITDAAVSRHLSVLRRAGLVTAEREGRFIRYSITTSVLEDALCFLMELRREPDASTEKSSS